MFLELRFIGNLEMTVNKNLKTFCTPAVLVVFKIWPVGWLSVCCSFVTTCSDVPFLVLSEFSAVYNK